MISDNLDEYALVIHCGACMINNKANQHRINVCNENNIPLTNYGVVLSLFKWNFIKIHRGI